MALQVLLGLHLLVQLVLQAVPLVLQLAQLGGHIELLPGFFLKQLLRVLELGPEGRHILGQLDGLPLGLVQHPRDALHFILQFVDLVVELSPGPLPIAALGLELLQLHLQLLLLVLHLLLGLAQHPQLPG